MQLFALVVAWAKTTYCIFCRCPRTSHSIRGCLRCNNCTVKYTDKDSFS